MPAASHATKITLPVEGATMNVSFQLQTQALVNQNGTPDGQNPSFDIFVRRSRLLINGDINQNFSYLVQFDNPNFGKYGNFTGRGYIQDAWIGWAPTGITGGNVLYIDAGLLLIPISHHLLESTTNFTTADVHTDSFRGLSGTAFPGLRDTGVQIRGWWLDKKIGFRGGVYEGYRNGSTSPAATGLAGNSSPQFAGFLNFDIIGTEEGGWLYGATKWGKDPILSVGFSGLYQSKALKAPNGVADQQLASADVYLNIPSGDSELVLEATGYLNRNGTGSADTGLGFFADLGYRVGFIEPYVSYEYFNADDCPDVSVLPKGCTAHTADSRNFRGGLNFFVSKNQNHFNLEFQENHGQSSYGPQSVSPAPATAAAGGAGSKLLSAPAQWSVLAHWNVIF